jgi:prepilin-type N-terminal cleavage/methylation domain-containing protein
MKKQQKKAFTLIELLVVIAIIAILAAILFPVFAQARSKARQASGLSNIKQVALAIYMYTQDYDEQFPRAGWECQTNADDAGIPVGSRNACGGTNWQNVTQPYTKNAAIYVSPGDSTSSTSSIGTDWGGDDLTSNDGNFSILINDLLSHNMGSNAAGYADVGAQSHFSNGLSQAAVNAPADCIIVMDGHCGWSKNPGTLDPAEAKLFNGKDALLDPTVKKSKYFKEQTMSGNQTALITQRNYGNTQYVKGKFPFYNDGGNVGFSDGHAKWYKFADPSGNPIVCGTLPWTKHVDPQQRQMDKNSCTDPANKPGVGSGNWN